MLMVLMTSFHSAWKLGTPDAWTTSTGSSTLSELLVARSQVPVAGFHSDGPEQR